MLKLNICSTLPLEVVTDLMRLVAEVSWPQDCRDELMAKLQNLAGQPGLGHMGNTIAPNRCQDFTTVHAFVPQELADFLADPLQSMRSKFDRMSQFLIHYNCRRASERTLQAALAVVLSVSGNSGQNAPQLYATFVDFKTLYHSATRRLGLNGYTLLCLLCFPLSKMI